MADFGSCCAGKHEFGADFDIDEIFESLPDNHYMPVLCEGCGLKVISKDENGKFRVAYMGSDEWEYELRSK